MIEPRRDANGRFNGWVITVPEEFKSPRMSIRLYRSMFTKATVIHNGKVVATIGDK